MLILSRGQKVSLADFLSSLRVRFAVQASGLTLDYSCFGLDAANRLADDRYFVFYNQKQSPEKAVRLVGDAEFRVDLSRLPEMIHKLVFVVTVDGQGEFQQIGTGSFSLHRPDGEHERFEFQGSDFSREKAVIVAEIYRRNGWRLAAVGQGFSGGLDAVLTHFGGHHKEQTSTGHMPNSSQNQSESSNSIVCVRCERRASSWADLRHFDSHTGRCTQCVTEVQIALSNLRSDFLSATQSGVLRDEAWQALWKRFDGSRQKVSHREALEFLRPTQLSSSSDF